MLYHGWDSGVVHPSSRADPRRSSGATLSIHPRHFAYLTCHLVSVYSATRPWLSPDTRENSRDWPQVNCPERTVNFGRATRGPGDSPAALSAPYSPPLLLRTFLHFLGNFPAVTCGGYPPILRRWSRQRYASTPESHPHVDQLDLADQGVPHTVDAYLSVIGVILAEQSRRDILPPPSALVLSPNSRTSNGSATLGEPSAGLLVMRHNRLREGKWIFEGPFGAAEGRRDQQRRGEGRWLKFHGRARSFPCRFPINRYTRFRCRAPSKVYHSARNPREQPLE